jgi:catechol 2,3-dioxygenase-like lactoylglutathione lyase family enzyme
MTLTCRLIVTELHQAETVRRIFERYAAGDSMKRIAIDLNDSGILSPQPQKGRVSSIRHILRNDRYRGLVVWGKTQKVRSQETGKRIYRRRPQSEWRRRENPEQRIVSEELWEAVRSRMRIVEKLYDCGPGRRPRGLIITVMGSPPPPQGPNASSFRLERLVPHFRIHSLAIFVADMDRSLRFYLDQLGFNLIADTHISIGRWVAVAPPDGTAMLVLVNPEHDSQEYKLIGRSRHVVLVAEDVVANFQEWSKRGPVFTVHRRHRAGAEWKPASKIRMGTLSCWWATMQRLGNSKRNAALHKNWKLPNRFKAGSSHRCFRIFHHWTTQVFASRLARSVAITTIS